MQMAKLSPQDKILGLKSNFLPNFYYLYTQQFKHHPIGLRHRRATLKQSYVAIYL